MCRRRERPLGQSMMKQREAEWGKNNPGQSHRSPMLEELKDEYGNEKQNIFQAVEHSNPRSGSIFL